MIGCFRVFEYLQKFLQIFVLFKEWIVTFTLYLPIFSNALFIIFLSHLNIISLFVLYSFF